MIVLTREKDRRRFAGATEMEAQKLAGLELASVTEWSRCRGMRPGVLEEALVYTEIEGILARLERLKK
jgi:hypothetical protein